MTDKNYPICNWETYTGSHCRRNNEGEGLCIFHGQIIKKYGCPEKDSLCSTNKEIKVVPRSYLHIKSVMKKVDNEDDLVDVYISRGNIEEADLSNHECVTILSDNYKYYYTPLRGQPNAKKIKIILKEYCKNSSVVRYEDEDYCDDCFKKIKGVPKMIVIKEFVVKPQLLL